MTAQLPAGFTKPPMLGVHATPWRLAGVAIFTGAWIAATWGRLHPALVAIPPLIVAAIVLTTIYHVSLTRWVSRWVSWRRHRSDLTTLPDPGAVVDIPVDGAGDIGVVIDDDRLVTMIALNPDPLAPTVVTDTEERTINTITVSRIAELLRLADVNLESLDIITIGTRAAGGFSDLYQQMLGPVPAASSRTSWLVLRIGMLDNVTAISRRAVRADAARRTAAVACLRAADALSAEGLDARPATAAEINAVNDVLHAEPPLADHWSHLESRNSFTGVYYADPAHIAEDAAQWWTWPLARDVTTLIRLRNNDSGHPQLAALVRYRTNAAPAAPPVSRLGPLNGVQRAAWRQFRVGSLPQDAPLPWSSLVKQNPVLPFGPTGPVIGSLPTTEKAAVHLPLVAPISVVCPSPLLLRQVALRATATGRPLIVVTSDPAAWHPIVDNAVDGTVLTALPEEMPADAILVVDGPMPLDIPDVTVLTSDASHRADISLTDVDESFNFTLTVRTGLTAQLRAVPSHEERRLLGVVAPATDGPRQRPRRTQAAASSPNAPAPLRVPTAEPAAPVQRPALRWGEAPTGQSQSIVDGDGAAGRHNRTADVPAGSHLPPAPNRPGGRHSVPASPPLSPSATPPRADVTPDTDEEPLRWPNA